MEHIAKALSQFQGKLNSVTKDAKNPFFKSTYATLNQQWDACRDTLFSCGLSLVQITKISEKGSLVLESVLLHESGQSIKGEYPIFTTKTDPQSIGSALTYARRYTMAAILGLSSEDDDGEKAMGRGEEDQKDPKKPQGSPQARPDAQPSKPSGPLNKTNPAPASQQSQSVKQPPQNQRPPAFDQNEKLPEFPSEPKPKTYPKGSVAMIKLNEVAPEMTKITVGPDFIGRTIKDAWMLETKKAAAWAKHIDAQMAKGEIVSEFLAFFTQYGRDMGLHHG